MSLIDTLAREFEEGRNATTGTEVISEITAILNALPDRTQFLNALITVAKRRFFADHALILSYHRQTDRWFVEASIGLNSDVVEEIRGLSWTVIDHVSKETQTLLIEDAPSHELTKNSASISAFNILSVLCAPIQDDRGLWGLIYLDNCSIPNAFAASSQAQIRTFADFAGIAIQRCEDIVKLQRHPKSPAAGHDAVAGYFEYENPVMVERMNRLRKAAAADVPLLLTGETGTGKDVHARWIHHLSPRKDGPFIHVNCSSLAPNLVESELFGIESKVATGVNFREGLIKMGDGGTVFLNEIGELPLSMQAKILRVIAERVVDRVGGKNEVGVDVRFICATNRDLSAMIKAGEFRSDLFFRINMFETEIPPLRERPEDLPGLATYILNVKCDQYRRKRMRLPKTTLLQLASLPWKGNVRELVNLIERGVILLEGDEFVLDHNGIPDDRVIGIPRLVGTRTNLPATMARIEKQLIIDVLRDTGWSQPLSASQLGVPPSTLRAKMKRLGIKQPQRVARRQRNPASD